jgi:hypothetical protein
VEVNAVVATHSNVLDVVVEVEVAVNRLVGDMRVTGAGVSKNLDSGFVSSMMDPMNTFCDAHALDTPFTIPVTL